MSTGLEKARERAGHYHQDVVLQRGIAAAVHEIDEQRHRADKAEAALALLSEAVTVPVRRLSDREVLDNVARLIARHFGGTDDHWESYLDAARAVVDFLQSEGVVA